MKFYKYFKIFKIKKKNVFKINFKIIFVIMILNKILIKTICFKFKRQIL